MSILNQSITSHGQPAFPSKGANSKDVSQYLRMAYSLHRHQSLKLFLPSSLKKTTLVNASGDYNNGESTLVNASGDFNNGESFSKKIELEINIHKDNDLLKPVNEIVCKLPCLFKDEDNLNLLTQSITHIKQGASHTTVSSDAEFRPFTLSFLHSLMENEKINLIKDAMAEIDLFSATLSSVLVVAVSSAVKLESNQMNQIARKMERVTGYSNLRFENTVDPSLIAGLVISYEKEGSSHVIDLSVKGQLDELVVRIESTE